jgi:hypothetical protein
LAYLRSKEIGKDQVVADGLRSPMVYGAEPTLGTDRAIPRRSLSNLYRGISIAWQLTSNEHFLDVYRKTVGAMTDRENLPPEIYASTLNSMRLYLAETSRNPLIIDEVRGVTHLEGSAADAAPALTIARLGQTWLRDFCSGVTPAALREC